MIRKLLLILSLFTTQWLIAQTVNIIEPIEKTGRFQNANVTLQPVTFISSTHNSVTLENGKLKVNNLCGNVNLKITISVTGWNSDGEQRWHGFFFEEGSDIIISNATVPEGWLKMNQNEGACSGYTSDHGFYYNGSTFSSSCGCSPTAEDNDPSNNWGDSGATSERTFEFDMTFPASMIAGNEVPITMYGKGHGGTGCFSSPDNLDSRITFRLEAEGGSAGYEIEKNIEIECALLPSNSDYIFTSTFSITNCSLCIPNEVTWWNTAEGGNPIGTGLELEVVTDSCPLPDARIYVSFCPLSERIELTYPPCTQPTGDAPYFEPYMVIGINDLIFCEGTTGNLPNISDNGIPGKWNIYPFGIPQPSMSIPSSSTTLYFKPDDDYCYKGVHISILPPPVIDDYVGEFCQGEPPQLLPTPKNIHGDDVEGYWSPSNMIDTTFAGTFEYTFYPEIPQEELPPPYAPGTFAPVYPPTEFNYCLEPITIEIKVWPAGTADFTLQLEDEYCVDNYPDSLPTIDDNGNEGIWLPEAINPDIIGVPQTFTFTPDNSCVEPTAIEITLLALKTPEFSDFPTEMEVCENELPIVLPNESDNNIEGFWNATQINGSGTYIFSPNDNDCTETYTITVIVTDAVTPVFDDMQTDYCVGDSPDALESISDNGIEGTWNPAVIDTSTSGTTSYTFTPNIDCGVPFEISITIHAMQTPVFDDLQTDYCVGDSPDTLESISDNGISGTWNPAVIDTSTSGTTTYTFTPNADCGVPFEISITIHAMQTPVFDDMQTDYCVGDSSDALESISDNGIEGTWNPAIIDTSTSGTTSYTFTPNADCGVPFEISITIHAMQTPVFDDMQTAYCVGDSPDTLESISDNGIEGTWNPAVIDTSAIGSFTYTFTPTEVQCAEVVEISIEITESILPEFSFATEFCLDAIPAELPVLSDNGITGTWNPATIDTSAIGIFTYTFTPTEGQCAEVVEISIEITESILPEFSFATEFCLDAITAELPDLSDNGIEGTWNPAVIDTSAIGIFTYTFTPTEGQCAEVVEISIEITESILPEFSFATEYCLNAIPAELPDLSDNGIEGTWNPAVIDTSAIGIFTYTFTPTEGQCAEVVEISIEITESILPEFSFATEYCLDAIPAELPDLSDNGITGTWEPAVIDTSVIGSFTYTFTPTEGQCAEVVEISIEITESILPEFSFATEFCLDAIPAELPDLSDNGISGTWNPATIDTSAIGSFTYTFTPTEGQCAEVVEISIEITESILPEFSFATEFCLDAIPAELPDLSDNGIEGTWNPAVIDTSAIGIFTYTFTPTEGQCAEVVEISIEITESILPEFSFATEFCLDAIPAELPDLSDNGITGTWNPAVIDTSAIGSFTYVFTPTEGQCAEVVAISIEITESILPEFSFATEYCLNAIPAELPELSDNGITGTWNPAVIDTSAIGSFTYTFTPTEGQCAEVVEISIEITESILPEFSFATEYCLDAIPAELPDLSDNGITGTWEPAVIDTSVIGSFTYTFTPTEGQCAEVVEISIEITESILPEFSFATEFCLNAIPAELPDLSDNGITGTWNPATIDTSVIGSFTYTFTPTEGQCAEVVEISIEITESILPEFSFATEYCLNAIPAELPDLSDNGITGTWNPATIDTSAIGSFTYTFTPTEGQCAEVVEISIEITESILPEFSFATEFCLNAIPAELPELSDNGISGTWNPATIDTSAIGSFTYVFTPTEGQCAEVVEISIEITENILPEFSFATEFCLDAIPAELPDLSDNGISGTWNPATIDTSAIGSFTYVFTPTEGQCAEVVEISIEITENILPEFSFATEFCLDAIPAELPDLSDNGITGTWEPAVIDTSAIGSFTYTFTPTEGQCAEVVEISIEITESILPEFSFATEYCLNAIPAELPDLSDNGIEGTWNPAVIDTSAIGIFTYTFTPTEGQCAEVVEISIEITESILPEFSFATEYCLNAIPAELPDLSDNGIEGTWNPAVIDTSAIGIFTYTFTPTEGQCAEVVEISIEITESILPEFSFATEFCLDAIPAELPDLSDNGITGTWNPATIDTSAIGSFTYVFTPTEGQCAEVVEISIEITESILPEFSFATEYCLNAIPAELPDLSDNGIEGTWNPAVIDTSAIGIFTYTFTPTEGQCAEVVEISIEITESILPEFSFATEYCLNAIPAELPDLSDNGITGTWEPAVIDTSTIGSFTYVFTPTEGQCAEVVEISIEITESILPEFSFATEYCLNAIPVELPDLSDNGITGTWNPATIDTSTIGSFTYVFTPTEGQCAEVVEISIEITESILPEFSFATEYCLNAIPAELPDLSDNGITGTWNPATIDTSAIGSFTYVFTPTEGQCAEVVEISIEITESILPKFSFATEFCLDAIPVELPDLSDNGITGTWEPAVIDTSAIGIFTYTFTPTEGQCAEVVEISIEITESILPEFSFATEYCLDAIPAELPDLSDNGITGTWEPAVIDTSAIGSFTYTFTPTEGQCAEVVEISIEITESILPEFSFATEYCLNAIPAELPDLSDNGITGTWNPAVIDTSAIGSFTYTFTPTEVQCAEVVEISIEITENILPEFSFATEYCLNAIPAELPDLSDNGITGTWEPAVIDTSAIGSFTYTFTPTEGQCAEIFTIEITISGYVTPEFTDITTLYCQGETPDVLPTISDNGVSGTWIPAVINTSTPGVTHYTFIPDALCSTSIGIDIEILESTQLNPLPAQGLCVDENGQFITNLMELESQLGGGLGTAYSYYATLADLNNDNPIPTAQLNNYQFTALPSTIYVVGAYQNGCHSDAVAVLFEEGDGVPHAQGPFALGYCPGYLLDLTQVENTITTESNVIFSYYLTLEAAQSGIGQIDDPTQFNPTLGQVYVSMEKTGYCNSIVTVQIEESVIPEMELSEYFVKICDGEEITVSASSDIPNATFEWSLPNGTILNGATQVFTESGIWTVIAYTGNSCISDEHTLTISAALPPTITSMEIGSDYLIVSAVSNDGGDLEYSIDGIFWQSNPKFSNLTPGGTYTVWVRSGCALTTFDVTLQFTQNFFSPNGDGINDFWEIRGITTTAESSIQIFDRYGKIFVSTKFTEDFKWNGRYNGRNVLPGDYWYIIKIPANGVLPEQRYMGHISVRNQ
ncbi:MAG: T9SS type B sorting domain-containing protein [Weeksellaceae bacterium]